MTNFEVRSIVEGWIGEADGIIEDFKKRNIESGLDMSMDKQVNWPRMSCRKVWMGARNRGKLALITELPGKNMVEARQATV